MSVVQQQENVLYYHTRQPSCTPPPTPLPKLTLLLAAALYAGIFGRHAGESEHGPLTNQSL